MRVTLKKMRIAELAVDRYGTMTEFAKAIGISRQALGVRINCGRCMIENAVKMARILGVELSEIIKEEGDI